MFFEKLVCLNGYVFMFIEIELCIFFFNVFFGVCLVCFGFGICMFVDVDLMLGDEDFLICEGVIILWIM